MAKAIYRHIIMAPNKVRRIANLVRGQSVAEAEALLATLPQRAREVVAKTLKSAAANAENNEGAERDALRISTIFVDEGMTIKRFQPRARGRADRIRKRTSHLTVVVEPGVKLVAPKARRSRVAAQGKA